MELKKIESKFLSLKSRSKLVIFEFLPTYDKINFMFINRNNLNTFRKEENFIEFKYYLSFLNLKISEIISFLNQVKLEIIPIRNAFISYLINKNISFAINQILYKNENLKTYFEHYPYIFGTGDKLKKIKKYKNYLFAPGVTYSVDLYYSKIRDYYDSILKELLSEEYKINKIHKIKFHFKDEFKNNLYEIFNFLGENKVSIDKANFHTPHQKKSLIIPFIKINKLKLLTIGENIIEATSVLEYLNTTNEDILIDVLHFDLFNKINSEKLLNLLLEKKNIFKHINTLELGINNSHYIMFGNNFYSGAKILEEIQKNIDEFNLNNSTDKKLILNLNCDFYPENELAYRILFSMFYFKRIILRFDNFEEFKDLSDLYDNFKLNKYWKLIHFTINKKKIILKRKVDDEGGKIICIIYNGLEDLLYFFPKFFNESEIKNLVIKITGNQFFKISEVKDKKKAIVEKYYEKILSIKLEDYKAEKHFISFIRKFTNLNTLKINNLDFENESYDTFLILLYDNLSANKNLRKLKVGKVTYLEDGKRKTLANSDYYLQNCSKDNKIINLSLNTFDDKIAAMLNNNFKNLRKINIDHIDNESSKYIEKNKNNFSEKLKIIIVKDSLEKLNILDNFHYYWMNELKLIAKYKCYMK